MDKHIEQFVPHTEAYIAKVTELTEALKEHKKHLDSVMSATVEEARIHRDMTEHAYQNRIQEEKSLNETRELHKSEKAKHSEWLSNFEIQKSQKETEYADLENKYNALENRVKMLILETQVYSKKISDIMPQLSSLERSLKETQNESNLLTKGISTLKEEEASVKSSIESSKKELSRIQEDISIAKAR